MDKPIEPSINYNDYAEDLKVETVPDSDVTVTIQYLPDTIGNPQNLPVLKWVCTVPYYYYDYKWSESAVCELNQVLADKNMPFRVQIILVKMDNYEWYYSTHWLSLPEVQEVIKDADLLLGMMGPNERQEYLTSITEYITGDVLPSLKNSVIHKLNLIVEQDDEILGFPTISNMTYCNGWRVKSEALAQYGLTASDFKHDFWEMDTLFAKIYKENGNQPFLYIDLNDGGVLTEDYGNIKTVRPNVLFNETKYAYQYVGGYFGIDFDADTPTVVNTLETETFRKIRSAITRYRAAGYTTVDTKDASAFMLAQLYYTSVGGNAVFTDPDGFIQIPVTTTVVNNGYKSCMFNGITATSQKKDEAILLLNLIAEDESFRNYLFCGKEGRDYEVRNGAVNPIRQEDGSMYDMRFVSMLSEFGDLCDETEKGYPTHEGKTKQQTNRDCLDNAENCYLPIVFDYTGFATELETLGTILGEFYDTYSKLNEDQYDQMLQKLKDAGGDRIQAELQRQLDEWLAEHPEWNSESGSHTHDAAH